MKFILIFVLLFLTTNVEARRYRYSVPTAITYQISTEKNLYGNKLSLQDVAMLRAKWMAHKNTLDHNIHTYTKHCPTWAGHGASGEGIGMSSDPNYKNCPTCIVGSTVVADGWAKAKNGTIYRVRLFK